MTPAQLASRLKKGEIAPAYVFAGPEAYQRRQLKQLLIESLMLSVAGGLIGLGAIFLPSFLLVIGALPLWAKWRSHPAMQSALTGINAAVVGLLAAALYNPVWRSAIFTPADFVIAASAFVLLVFLRAPPWLVVLLGAAVTGLAG